jgi:transcriptional regulator with XRE-family HTH domain
MNGQELKQRRNKLGLTRSQLASLLGVSEDAVYRWETNRLPILPNRKADFEKIEAKLNKHQTNSTNPY